MNNKIILKLDVSKIDKNKIVKKSFTNKDGETINKLELDLELIPLNSPRMVKDAPTYQLLKTHFISIPQTKEEKENRINSRIIGDGLMFKNKSEPVPKVEEDIMPESNDIDESSIPF